MTPTDDLERLQRIDAASILPGAPDGVQAAYAYTDETWRDDALAVATALAATGLPFTVETLRRHGVPDPTHPNEWGSLVAAIRHRGIARMLGWISTRDRHGERAIRVWVGDPTRDVA